MEVFITGPANQSKMILDWRELEKNFPWSLLFMVGGAFAISDGAAVCLPLFTNFLFVCFFLMRFIPNMKYSGVIMCVLKTKVSKPELLNLQHKKIFPK